MRAGNKLEIKGNFLKPMQSTYKKCTANILRSGETVTVFSIRSAAAQGSLL